MIKTHAIVERKTESLPAFVVLDEGLFVEWDLTGTTVVEVSLGSTEIGRRSLKRWPERSGWFVDLTAGQLKKTGIDVGDSVLVELRRASTDPPEELRRLLDSDAEARRRWALLSEARRRAVSEHVREAKQASTRQRRARKALEM
ncbi:MAG: YdeI/OmpD-associated family protein [Gemmatimonadetes bacterium]|nr:YdeI/OmpD-associated family protein [Gemmatimonadota bacterium]